MGAQEIGGQLGSRVVETINSELSIALLPWMRNNMSDKSSEYLSPVPEGHRSPGTSPRQVFHA